MKDYFLPLLLRLGLTQLQQLGGSLLQLQLLGPGPEHQSEVSIESVDQSQLSIDRVLTNQSSVLTECGPIRAQYRQSVDQSEVSIDRVWTNQSSV